MTEKIIKGEKRKSVGELSNELLEKTPDTLDPIELQQEIQGDSYEAQFLEAMDRAMGKYHRDFFIVTVNQRFRLFSNVCRTYFIDRISCPTPDFDQNVYRINKKSGEIEFLWSIPDKNTCLDMYNNPFEVPEEQLELRKFVFEFYDGTLLKRCKKLNNEEEADLIIMN